MNQQDICNMLHEHHEVTFDGDNRKFIVLSILPVLDLSNADKQVIRWAYGYDGSDRSYEIESDGETIVKDYFMGGKLKSPQGVTHDYINRVIGHTTPNGQIWKRQESNNLYLRIAKAAGYPPLLRWVRWAGVSAYPFWWK